MNFSERNAVPSDPSQARAGLGRPLRRVMVLLLLGFFALAAPLAPTAPPAQPQRLEEKLIGAWRLVSVEGQSRLLSQGYDHPTGLVVFDRSGWMSLQIAIHGERKPFANGVSAATVEEKAEAFDTYVAYYGTYAVDAKADTVTFHLANHSYPGFRGRDNVRWFEFQDDNRFVLIPTEDGKGGRIARKDATYKLTWERIR